MISLKTDEDLINENKKNFILSLLMIGFGLISLSTSFINPKLVIPSIGFFFFAIYFDNARNRDLIRIELRGRD